MSPHHLEDDEADVELILARATRLVLLEDDVDARRPRELEQELMTTTTTTRDDDDDDDGDDGGANDDDDTNDVTR